MQVKEISKKIITELESVFKEIDGREIKSAIDYIIKAGRIFVIGVGREGLSSRGFAMRLMHLGKTVYWVWDDTTPNIEKNDLLIATTGSGYLHIVNNVITSAKKEGANILVFTGNKKGEAVKLADGTVFLPAKVWEVETSIINSIQPMGSLFEQSLFILFDIMVILLKNILNLTDQDLTKRHRNVE